MEYLAGALTAFVWTMAPVAPQPLICFGSEPSWSIDLTVADRARVTGADFTTLKVNRQSVTFERTCASDEFSDLIVST